MVFATLRTLLGTSQHREAQELYIALVSQSRKAFFYTNCAVADTLDGRFDILVLHVFLALHCIEGQASDFSSVSAKKHKELSRVLLECFFADMDRSLREIGVGDMGIGKRVKTMSKAAFGRFKAYAEAWDSDAALNAALKRNIYRGSEVTPDALTTLIKYMRDYIIPSFIAPVY